MKMKSIMTKKKQYIKLRIIFECGNKETDHSFSWAVIVKGPLYVPQMDNVHILNLGYIKG